MTQTSEGQLDLARPSGFLAAADWPTLPPLSQWHVWPGVDPKTEIPSNARQVGSGIWTAPAPKSAGPITIVLQGQNFRFWRYYGMSRDARGPWGGCPPTGDCHNSWCAFSREPSFSATGPAEVTASYYFSNWSHDLDRACYWAVLFSAD